jgi:hypothetical protein
VRLGNLLLIPIEQSILYVRPLYTQAEGGTPVPLLRRVIVAYGDEIVMADTLRDALVDIFDTAPQTLEEPGDRPEQPSPDGEEEPPDGEEPEPAAEVADLLARAQELFEAAEAGLAEDGDLGAYQDRIERAQQLIEQALELSAPTTTTVPPAEA